MKNSVASFFFLLPFLPYRERLIFSKLFFKAVPYLAPSKSWEQSLMDLFYHAIYMHFGELL